MYEYALPVEGFHQRSQYTCLASCVRMVLNYFGEKINELSFYRESQLSPDYPGLCDVCIASPLIKRGFKVTSYWNGRIEDWGVWTADLASLYKDRESKAMKTKKYSRHRNASLDMIKKFIIQGIPVIAEVFAGKFYGTNEIGTHMIMVRGFNRQGLLICDPWGMQHFISYPHFLKAWNPSKNFGRSMIVIQPISKSKFPLRLGV